MAEAAGTTLEGALARGRRQTFAAGIGRLAALYRAALETEAEHRRFFLWVPVAFGSGIVLYFCADREPLLPLTAGLAGVFAAVAAVASAHRRAFALLVGLAALFAGMAVAG